MLSRNWRPSHKRGTREAQAERRLAKVEAQLSAVCWELERQRRHSGQRLDRTYPSPPDETQRWVAELATKPWPHVEFWGEVKDG